MHLAAVLRGALAVTVCLAATGCTAAGPSAGSLSQQPPVAAAPSAEVRGELLQFRRDVERRRLEIRLVAAGAGLVVEELQLQAPGLTVTSGLEGEAALRDGAGLDLPVTMGPADCTVSPAPPVAVLQLRDATGARRTVAVPLDDDGLAGRLHDEDCADQALLAQVDIRVTGAVPVPSPRGPALQVSVALRRLDGTDPVAVTGTGSNTVYDITAAGPLPTLRQGSAELQLLMVPARCDVHALGESYRTGLIGLVVALGDTAPRPWVLTPDPDVRHTLETFAVTTCRPPAG